MNDDGFGDDEFDLEIRPRDDDGLTDKQRKKAWTVIAGTKSPSGNSKVMVLAVVLVIILLAASCAVFLWPNERRAFDHTRVSVQVDNTTCYGAWDCDNCTTIEQSRGCCRGCNPDVPPLNACSFEVTMGYENVTSYSVPQRVWLFASLDGFNYYTTGYAPFVQTTNTSLPASGSATITDGCFGGPDNQIILVACLSDRNLKDLNFAGFPATQCNSTHGICVNSNNVAVQDIHECNMGEWIPNNHTQAWSSAWYGTTGDFITLGSTASSLFNPLSSLSIVLIAVLFSTIFYLISSTHSVS